MEKTRASIRKLLDINYNGVDEKIIVHKDYFEWKLNFMNDMIKLEISGKRNSDYFLVEYK